MVGDNGASRCADSEYNREGGAVSAVEER
jgi:hypothetical protein